jgi:hypothetical protein
MALENLAIREDQAVNELDKEWQSAKQKQLGSLLYHRPKLRRIIEFRAAEHNFPVGPMAGVVDSAQSIVEIAAHRLKRPDGRRRCEPQKSDLNNIE